MQGAIKGKDFLLYFPANGNPNLAAHAQDVTVKFTADVNETTTKNGLKGKTYDYQGKYSYTVTLKGVTNFIDATNVNDFQSAIFNSNKLLFIFTDNKDVQYSGTILVNEVDFDSAVDGVSTFTNTMQGDGEIEVVVSSGAPVPIGYSVDVIDQFGDLLVIIPAPSTYTVSVFDTIEQGGASPITPQILIIPAA